jgi:hypothetical protein
MASWQLRSEDEMDKAERGLNPDLRQCTGPCQQRLTKDRFDKDASKADGLKAWCKECRRNKREAERDKQISQVLGDLDAATLVQLASAPSGGSALPHQVQALEAVMQLFGGVNGFANMYVANILAAPPGSQARQRALDKVWTAIQMCSDDAKVSKPREQMTDEELDQVTRERMKRMGIVIDATDVRETA